MSIGFGAYGEKKFHGLNSVQFVDLSPQMKALLPGASLAAGYSISPDKGGYFGIKGPDLLTPAFTSGAVDFKHPITQQLLFKTKASKKEKIISVVDEATYDIAGWALVALIVFLFIKAA